MTGRKAIFLDRDGVLNEDRGYVGTPDQFQLLPGVPEALARLRDAGYLLIVVTNQSGIARGYYDETQLAHLHAHMGHLLNEYGVTIDAIYFCPHHSAGAVERYAHECRCRKPQPGMIERGIAEFGIDPKTSMLVGDKMSDVQAGRAAGLGRLFLIGGSQPGVSSARDLPDVVAQLLTAQGA